MKPNGEIISVSIEAEFNGDYQCKLLMAYVVCFYFWHDDSSHWDFALIQNQNLIKLKSLTGRNYWNRLRATTTKKTQIEYGRQFANEMLIKPSGFTFIVFWFFCYWFVVVTHLILVILPEMEDVKQIRILQWKPTVNKLESINSVPLFWRENMCVAHHKPFNKIPSKRQCMLSVRSIMRDSI